MSNKLDPKETVTYEELLLSNTIQQEAMFNILERKGLMSKKELLEEIKKLRQSRVL
jgi:hypothetical protein